MRVESAQRGEPPRDGGRLAARATLPLQPRQHVVAARGVQRPPARPEDAEEIADVAAVGVGGVAPGGSFGAWGGGEFLDPALGLPPVLATKQPPGPQPPSPPRPRTTPP